MVNSRSTASQEAVVIICWTTRKNLNSPIIKPAEEAKRQPAKGRLGK